MTENQKRTIHYSFKATPEEDGIIQKKMELAGIKNQSAFIHRIVLGGFYSAAGSDGAEKRGASDGKSIEQRESVKIGSQVGWVSGEYSEITSE